MSRRRKALALGVVAALAALAGGCKSEAHDEAAATPPQPVQVMTVTLQSNQRAWSYVGTVEPRYQSDLGFRVGGKIVARQVEIGQRVGAGQVIAKLDPVDFELSLAAQEAELAAARTSRDEATAALGRYETLFRQGHVSKAALDQRASGDADARSRVDRAERTTALAANQLAYATLTADHDGVVTALPVEVGQVVAAGQLVAKVARLDAIEVEVAIPEQQVDLVKSARAEVELWAGNGRRMAASVREVSPEADPVSRTYRARFALSDSTLPIDLGRTATVHLAGPSSATVAAVPLAAVMNDGTTTMVWVVSADKTRAIPTPVVVQALEQDRALIASGLKAGDQIVTLGVHMLDPDKPIRVIEQRTALIQN